MNGPTVDKNMQNTDHVNRINDVLSYIHLNLAGDLRAEALASRVSFSEGHFHRIFKLISGESVHQYVRRTRMEAAANQLMFSPRLSTTIVSHSCGFASLSSFCRAFKQTYGTTPKEWASGPHYNGSCFYLEDPEIKAAYQRLKNIDLPTPKIVEVEQRNVAYIRHTGYGRSIENAWVQLKSLMIEQGRSIESQIGIHHSNPITTPLNQCRYVACMEIDNPVPKRGLINSATIPGGLHAAFELTGHYGDLLPYISKISESWLPTSGYVAKTSPAFAIYRKNQFLSDDDEFELTFCVPITLRWLPQKFP